jgi:glycosyltransferase involved in cell wall biosynthesis
MSQSCDADRGVAVSLTPLALEADSRAYRIACSLADAGFRSVVVEGCASRSRFWSEPIEVRSLPFGLSSSGRQRGGGLRAGRFGVVGEVLLYAAFRGHEWRRHYRRPLGFIPAADLYYVHSFELHRAAAAAAAARRAPIIYDAHDFYRGINPDEAVPAFDRHRLRPFLNALEDRLVAASAGVVTVSDGIADLMERTFGRRPVVIRNCHDERRDQPVAADLRRQLSLSPADRLSVVVGNRKPGMAVDAAIAAFALLPEHFHLAFVGRGYEDDRERLGGDQLATRIHFGNGVAPNQVVPYIRTADLGLVLYRPYSENYRFALPNGFFQVIAAGLPVVRAALPEIEATIGDRDVGLSLQSLDPRLLADAIARCTSAQPALREVSASLARELSWRSEADKLHRLVDAVLASPARDRQSAAVA